MSTPRISIIVPILAGAYAPDEALRSLEAQGYPDLEVLVQPADGFGAALDRGFGLATGEIVAFLTPGDVLLEGALRRVATEIAPQQGRSVVMGDGLYLVDAAEPVGVAQPAEYPGFARHLRIWERGFDVMSYSSLFWHREVLADIGKLSSEPEPAVAAYALSCRIGARHSIHKVEERWSASRVPPGTTTLTEAETLDALIDVSRRHWGGWLSPLRWGCEVSWRRHAGLAHERARHHARNAEAARAAGDRIGFLREYVQTWRHEPRMARERLGRCN